jgi:hypothetical protein
MLGWWRLIWMQSQYEIWLWPSGHLFPVFTHTSPATWLMLPCFVCSPASLMPSGPRSPKEWPTRTPWCFGHHLHRQSTLVASYKRHEECSFTQPPAPHTVGGWLDEVARAASTVRCGLRLCCLRSLAGLYGTLFPTNSEFQVFVKLLVFGIWFRDPNPTTKSFSPKQVGVD